MWAALLLALLMLVPAGIAEGAAAAEKGHPYRTRWIVPSGIRGFHVSKVNCSTMGACFFRDGHRKAIVIPRLWHSRS